MKNTSLFCFNLSTTENTIAALASKFVNNTNKHIFLTGKAGTGKTTFLKYIIKHTYKNAMIVAPTGIAAINAGGVTIHSLFQLPFGAFVPAKDNTTEIYNHLKINNPLSLIKNLQINGTKRRLLQELDLLIIDEVSMLRADLLDAIDTVLRTIRRQSGVPFGGVQVLFIGDLLQLPPVIKDDEWQVLRSYYKSIYFFEAQALQHQKPLYIELDKIYRQTDNTFINLLNNLRTNKITQQDIELLNKYYKPDFKSTEKDSYIQLTTHNNKADSLNREALQRLNESSFIYKSSTTGDFNEFAFPVEEKLELKKGAQIMFIKNDPSGEQRFFNGKIGIVLYLSNDEIEVGFEDSPKTIFVEKYEWENIKYSLNEVTNEIEERVVGTFTQYPLKLAWAITVHKSQGLTFKKAIIDIGAAFAPGQVYVALSRLTSLDGLVLTSKINMNVLTENSTVTEYSNTKITQDPLSDILEKESHTFLKNYMLLCFNFKELNYKLQNHLESYSKDEQKSTKQKHFNWAVKLKADVEASKIVADKFMNQLYQIIENGETDYLQQLQTRIQAAKKYFTPILKDFSIVVINQIKKLQHEKQIKTYLTELAELDALFYKQLKLINKAEVLVDSVITNTVFVKQDSTIAAENKERIELHIQSLQPIKKGKRERVKKEKKTETKEKAVNTKEVSYTLYKQGLTIGSIATERRMATTTIEGHLAHYVSLGLLNVSDFVEKEKLENIITVSKTLDTVLLGTIKQSLGDEYSYTEIRFAMAFYENAKK